MFQISKENASVVTPLHINFASTEDWIKYRLGYFSHLPHDMLAALEVLLEERRSSKREDKGQKGEEKKEKVQEKQAEKHKEKGEQKGEEEKGEGEAEVKREEKGEEKVKDEGEEKAEDEVKVKPSYDANAILTHLDNCLAQAVQFRQSLAYQPDVHYPPVATLISASSPTLNALLKNGPQRYGF